jgi:hypothetical protein
MKENIKKLALFVMIPAIAMFMVVAMASADRHDHHGIQGEYAFTGTTSCLVSNLGFYDNLTPVSGSKVYYNSHSARGLFNFNRDGAGTFETEVAVFIVPPPAPGPPAPSVPIAGSFKTSAQFTYNITDGGMITIELVPGTWVSTFLTGPIPAGTTTSVDQWSLSGMVSADHKTLTLSSGGTAVETTTNSLGAVFHQICHRSSVLIRVDE